MTDKTAEQWEAEGQRLIDNVMADARAVQAKHLPIVVKYCEELAASPLSVVMKTALATAIMAHIAQGEKELRS